MEIDDNDFLAVATEVWQPLVLSHADVGALLDKALGQLPLERVLRLPLESAR